MEIGIKKPYFEWLCNLAFPTKELRRRYQRLLDALHTSTFRYIISLDENRMIDGIDLRERFCYEENVSKSIVEKELYIVRGCSVLEMMVALSLRCDEQIMFDFDIGNRTHIWFFEMLKNLGLDGQFDYAFDYRLYNLIIERFLNREYTPYGEGGLFVVYRRGDIRQSDIWYQMCWFLDERFEK